MKREKVASKTVKQLRRGTFGVEKRGSLVVCFCKGTSSYLLELCQALQRKAGRPVERKT